MPTSPPDSYTEKDKQCGSIATKLGGVQPVAGVPRHFSASSAKRRVETQRKTWSLEMTIQQPLFGAKVGMVHSWL